MGAPRIWTESQPIAVLGTGSALPGPAISTADLIERIERRFDVTLSMAQRVADRLGIATRHISRRFDTRRETAVPGEGNIDLAARALITALDHAGLGVDDLDYVIGHTATPARLLPSNIAFVAERIGYQGPYLELRQACTGFAGALVMAHGLLMRPNAGAVAIVGSETGSLFFDPLRAVIDNGQLVNLVQMGDGAGAVIVGPAGHNAADGHMTGIFSGQIGLGRTPGLTLLHGGSEAPFSAHDVFEFTHDFVAVRESGPALFTAGVAAAADIGSAVGSAQHIIPHQANGRIDSLIAPLLGVRPDQIFVNAGRLGNTGSAAIWLAFDALRGDLASGARVTTLGAEATKHMFGGFGYVHG